MKLKPWPIIILAYLHFLSPVFNVLISAKVSRMDVHIYAGILYNSTSVPELLALFLFPIAAGYAIYVVRRWSFIVYLFFVLWNFAINYHSYSQSPDLYGLPILVLAYLANLMVVGYFLIPAIRVAYLDPSIRWWESSPRYTVMIPATIEQNGSQAQAQIADISRGGIFLIGGRELTRDSRLILRFSFESLHFEIPAVVAHIRQAGSRGAGIRFIESSMKPEQKKLLKRLIQALELLRLPRRPGRRSWRDLKDWLHTLVTSGRGLVPELPDQYVSKRPPSGIHLEGPGPL